jgi:very-short-patch-repair endonuclease/molybdopterin-guanine dinucleotide biosynthesis protein A
VIISVNSSNAADFTGFHTVIDDVQGEGPLAGIVCSLKASSTEVNLIVACDIPYIDPRVIIRMFAETDDSDIAIPSFSSGSFEPLYGVYRKSITSIAESMLAKGQRRVSELFNRCRTKIVEMENGGRYANLNTKDDVEKYKKNLIPRPLLHHGEGEKTTKKEPFSIQALLHKSEGENTIQKELSSEMPLVHRGDGENTIKNQLNPTIFSQHNREMRISYFGEHQSPNNRTSGVTALQFVDEDKKRQSRSLRKSATAAEDILWSYLRNRKTGGFKFRRQQIIDGFIADFYCEESKLVIEVDGGVHDDENQIVIDSHRNNVFSARGIHTIRFKNNDVINHINTCLSEIIDISQRRKGLSQPLAGRRGVAEGRGEVIEEKEE